MTKIKLGPKVSARMAFALAAVLWFANLTAVSNSALEGALKPVAARPRVVHLWASWCAPCVAELPAWVAELKSLKSKVDVVFVSLDGPEKIPAAERLLRGYGVPSSQMLFPGMRNGFQTIQKFDDEWDGSIPTTYAWNRKGKLTAQRGFTDLSELVRLLRRN